MNQSTVNKPANSAGTGVFAVESEPLAMSASITFDQKLNSGPLTEGRKICQTGRIAGSISSNQTSIMIDIPNFSDFPPSGKTLTNSNCAVYKNIPIDVDLLIKQFKV
jgi:hypothetical protein